MARKSLSGMLSVVEDERDDAAATEAAAEPAPGPPQAQPEAVATPAPPPVAKRSPTTRPKQTPGRDAPKASAGSPEDEAADSLPRYLELTRKEARFTDEQLDELAALTRRLNKTRRGRGERITDNTLIRVAVDLLLQRAGDLAGHDETALRQSVGL